MIFIFVILSLENSVMWHYVEYQSFFVYIMLIMDFRIYFVLWSFYFEERYEIK